MARMIPAAFDPSTVSAAERRVFELFKADPATSEWVVLHSLGLVRRGHKPYGEIDFVVIIPRAGVFCLEVKGGRIACDRGAWETTDRNGGIARLGRSPFLQARDCMFALRDALLRRASLGFPADLIYGYAVVMPDISFALESAEWESWQVIDREALSHSLSSAVMRLASEQRRLLRSPSAGEPSPATVRTVQQLLRPDFEIVISRGTTIDDTESQLLRLTEEQFDMLDALSDNERCLFEGAAGTGKTMLGLEYARRAGDAGLRTMLVCFNRLFGDWLSRQVASRPLQQPPTTGSFFKVLRDAILRSSIASDFLEHERRGPSRELYEDTYPTCGRLAVEELGEQYDVLVVDEAQDLLRPRILEVLDIWLKGGLAGGYWAMFGDFQQQAIFAGQNADELRRALDRYSARYARGRLTLNCRNTRNIGEETALLSGFRSPPYRMGQVVGLPVDYHYYKSADAQAAIVAQQLRSLLSGGVKADEIVVLSRLRLEHSPVAGIDGGSAFVLVDASDQASRRSKHPTIRFATAQAFKGMESRVVVLCDVDQVSDGEPQSLLYVAMSRARSQLTILAHEKTRGSIAECIRKKLQEAWKGGQ
jgi:hypothetical protein